MPAFNLPKFIAYDSNGDPLSGGLVYVYNAGTSTEVTTYSDSGLSTANAHPVVLDSSGRGDVWVADGNYKVVVKDSDGNTQYTVDNISLVTATSGDVSSESLQQGTLTYAASSAGVDSYAISLALGTIAAYNAGMRFYFKADVGNTGAATLNVTNSDTVTALGAKAIVRANGDALETGDIVANDVVGVVYNGTNFRLLTNSGNNVYEETTQTLTNKTLTSPTINSGTYTDPIFSSATSYSPTVTSGSWTQGTWSSGTAVDVTLTSPTITSGAWTQGTWTSPTITSGAWTQGTWTSGTAVDITLTSPTVTSGSWTQATLSAPTISGGTIVTATLTQPAIADFTNATHTHSAAATGGTLDDYYLRSDSNDIAYGDLIINTDTPRLTLRDSDNSTAASTYGLIEGQTQSGATTFQVGQTGSADRVIVRNAGTDRQMLVGSVGFIYYDGASSHDVYHQGNMYVGKFRWNTATSTMADFEMPANTTWSVSRSTKGDFTLTHDLNTPNYAVIATPYAANTDARVTVYNGGSATAMNSATVRFYLTDDAGNTVDGGVSFMVTRTDI